MGEMFAWRGGKTATRTYHMVYRYFKPDGWLLGEVPDEWIMYFGNTRHYHECGLGWADPGHWQCGTYRLEILMDGVKFAEGLFVIE